MAFFGCEWVWFLVSAMTSMFVPTLRVIIHITTLRVRVPPRQGRNKNQPRCEWMATPQHRTRAGSSGCLYRFPQIRDELKSFKLPVSEQGLSPLRKNARTKLRTVSFVGKIGHAHDSAGLYENRRLASGGRKTEHDQARCDRRAAYIQLGLCFDGLHYAHI